MKKHKVFLVALIMLGFLSSVFAAEPVFTATTKSVVQNMVANSSQDIIINLSTKVPFPSAVNVHCEFSSSNPNLTASFNNNGCTSVGGVGILSTAPVTINLTVTTSAHATGTMTGTVTLTQTNGRSKQVISLPITVQAANRTITFKNYCPHSVWFGISSSAVPAKNKNTIACSSNHDCQDFKFSQCVNGFCGGGACRNDNDCTNTRAGTCAIVPGASSATCSYCAQNSDCMAGSQCNVVNHQCYWINPAPANAATNHYELAQPSGGVIATNTVTIPDFSKQNGYALQWGGGFAGRTHCTFAANKLTCKTANCNTNGTGNNHGGCNLGEGLATPSTSAEVTFVSQTPDTYDVTVINGANIPVSMHPTPGSAATPQMYNNPYLCGNAGNTANTVTNNGTLGRCSWNFNLPSPAYRWVDNDNATHCTTDATCTAINSSFRCGLTTTAIGATPSTGSSQTTCGTPLGYWTQNEICAKNQSYNPTPAGIINCTTTNIGGTGNSIINLLACTGPAAVSCYNINASSNTCCGCTNWQNQGITIPTNSTVVEQCSFPNSFWGAGHTPGTTGHVLPGLIWLKQACPSAYVYPFDDKASTFTCPGNNSQSGVNYTIEFCPPN